MSLDKFASNRDCCVYHPSNLFRPVGGRGSRGSNEPPLDVNNGGLKTKTVDFQLLANSRGMENKLSVCSF